MLVAVLLSEGVLTHERKEERKVPDVKYLNCGCRIFATRGGMSCYVHATKQPGRAYRTKLGSLEKLWGKP